MMVYSEIKKDARVMRAATALCQNYDVYIYACGEISIPKITSIPIKNCNSLGGYSTYIKFITGAITECIKIKPDIIYGHDIFSAIPMEILRPIYGKKCKYIYDAHELFMYQEGQKYSVVDRIQYHYEHLSIKKSDLVFCAEEKRAELMVNYHKLNNKPTVIRNISYLPEILDDSFKNEHLEFFDITATSVVYAGGMLAGRRLDKLIDAVNQVGKDYKLMLIGDGPAYDSLSKKIDSLNNKNICICKALPYAKLSAALINFDIGYLYYGTSDYNNLYCAPNKIYEYAGIGLPILANENPTVKKIITEENLGVCTDDFVSGLKIMNTEKDSYADALAEFVKNNSAEKEKELLLNVVNEVLK